MVLKIGLRPIIEYVLLLNIHSKSSGGNFTPVTIHSKVMLSLGLALISDWPGFINTWWPVAEQSV